MKQKEQWNQIAELIPLAERAYNEAIEAREAALDACVRAGTYLDKAKQAETDTKQLLDLLRQFQEQEDEA